MQNFAKNEWFGGAKHVQNVGTKKHDCT
ncbi:hypothetical protein SAST42_00049 [Staphylococcus aureus]|nr:hypothetical protein SAST42_00049 [Staphylococcus aureus]AMV83912.1 hypothetical protein SAST43_04357 [Staphylococcus aureus]EOR37081.1 hypothetical protein S103564_0286 [Staphylococcus aureus subsp. aureus 103564]